MSENTPNRIGDYEIIRELGHGGMGKVYQARNTLSDRIEALKVVLPDLAGRSEFVNRFMREIKVLASLEHPNIAALRTAFTADDQFVMVMEYVEGVTLADRLERGPFSTAEALNYIDQALAALSYAHGKHIVHRDIKPANMMLTPQGVVKLMDFGLARSADEVGLTMTGSTVGSLDYLSPEQVQSQPTDERSDLYSVGVSLYQMVTGQRMFSATSSYSIMEAHVKETPRPPIEVVAVATQAGKRPHRDGRCQGPGATVPDRRRISCCAVPGQGTLHDNIAQSGECAHDDAARKSSRDGPAGSGPASEPERTQYSDRYSNRSCGRCSAACAGEVGPRWTARGGSGADRRRAGWGLVFQIASGQ